MFHSGPPITEQLRSALDSEDDEEYGKVYDRRVVGRLPPYIASVKKWIALGAVGMVVRSLASLASPYLTAIAIDNFIKSGDFSGLNMVAIAFVLAQLIVWGGQFLETRYLSFASDAILFKLRTQMFEHLQHLSLSFFSRNKVGKIMSRVQNDVQQLEQLITTGALNIVVSLLTLIGIAIVMTIMNARLALLTLVVVPVLGVIIVLWQKHARRAFIRVRQAIAVVNSQLQENISGVRVVQSLSREDINYEQFDSVNRAHLDANIDATRLTALMMPVVEALTAIATGLVIVFGGFQVLTGTIGVGILLGFLLYIQRFFNPVLELTMEYTELQRAMTSGERIFELLDAETEIKDSPDAIELSQVKGEIQFEHVSFGYQSGIEVLHDIDLTIKPGEIVGIVGKTGAGKSSLASLLARFYDVREGRITIDGYDVRSVTQESLRRQIGFVPQDPFLFSGMIEDNIRYGNITASHEEIVQAAKIAGAHEFISHMEKGYETSVGERSSNLSAGQRQFVCLARAILGNPPILILDEATSNVDTNSERLIQKSLQSLIRGRTCLIIAHRLSTVVNADRLIVMERGRIVEMGSHGELMAKRGIYFNMFEALRTPDLEAGKIE